MAGAGWISSLLWSPVWVSGSGPGSVPETMSASQSPRPPGAASTAVWGLYTLIPSKARRSRDCCWVSARVRALKPLKMMGSESKGQAAHGAGEGERIRYETTTQSLRSIASSATALVRSMVSRMEFICRRIGSNGASSKTGSNVNFLYGELTRLPRHTTGVVKALICQLFRISGVS